MLDYSMEVSNVYLQFQDNLCLCTDLRSCVPIYRLKITCTLV